MPHNRTKQPGHTRRCCLKDHKETLVGEKYSTSDTGHYQRQDTGLMGHRSDPVWPLHCSRYSTTGRGPRSQSSFWTLHLFQFCRFKYNSPATKKTTLKKKGTMCFSSQALPFSGKPTRRLQESESYPKILVCFFQLGNRQVPWQDRKKIQFNSWRGASLGPGGLAAFSAQDEFRFLRPKVMGGTIVSGRETH